MSDQYPPGGALFQQDKKNQNSPDYSGEIEIDEAMLREIALEIQQASNGRTKMRIAGWKKMSKAGKPFLSLKPSTQTSSAAYSGGGGGGGGTPAGQSNDALNDEIPF